MTQLLGCNATSQRRHWQCLCGGAGFVSVYLSSSLFTCAVGGFSVRHSHHPNHKGFLVINQTPRQQVRSSIFVCVYTAVPVLFLFETPQGTSNKTYEAQSASGVKCCHIPVCACQIVVVIKKKYIKKNDSECLSACFTATFKPGRDAPLLFPGVAD